MKKKFNLRRFLAIALIVALTAGLAYLAFQSYKRQQEIDRLNVQIELYKTEQTSLWNCIVQCNKRKADNAECYCIQAKKKIKVY